MSSCFRFIESRVTKMRKPDPRIYAFVLTQLGVQANEAIFLDGKWRLSTLLHNNCRLKRSMLILFLLFTDIGMNLKPARDLGMQTIRVVTTAQALAEVM